ncbi:APC family permease [Paeniglutamicibacter psychrophenolicus]|uniref:APC family permease n=1 Tax=Paeniglutamicibacter psychrophenolicus TaxID=257454 RepID=UPI002787034E|nr:APC family permease [Paeniglutamicibacter psychrophenolicus]MDQ0094525.1 amino acid transporter [Paeniglutamicibacter psychrophenolicus]
MSLSTARRTQAPLPSSDTGLVRSKGLASGQLGLFAAVMIGISTIAPAYVLTSSLGPTVQAIGTQLPAIFIIGFIPMFLVALAYRELNADTPDSGTTFTWVSQAFGPVLGWLGGWGLLAANIIVLSNLAGVAVDFFYLFLAQVTGNPALAELANNKLLNVATCLVFVGAAVWIACRGLTTTRIVQYVLVGFQLAVLAWFTIGAVTKAAAQPGHLAFDASWFNPMHIDSFSAFAVGLSLSIFAFWGWDVCLTMNEETKNGEKTSGRAAALTAIGVLAIYLLGSIAMLMFAGIGESGLGLRNPENAENVFTSIATPVMGPFAVLLSLAVLSSCAASLQSTMISPARSLLAISHHGALPKQFASINRFKSPAFATVVAGGVSAGFYALMRVLSNNVLNDTILALGMMICFYYGLTALACVWYFRHTALDSVRNFALRLLAPLLGGIALVAVFIQTAVDSWDPAYGSGSEIFGVGLVFVIGVGIIALGALFLVGAAARRPEFFSGRSLPRKAPGSAKDRV